jgi:hypothetical protein
MKERAPTTSRSSEALLRGAKVADAEIGDPNVVIEARKEDIGGLKVTMNDILGVGSSKGIGELDCDAQNGIHVPFIKANSLFEIAARKRHHKPVFVLRISGLCFSGMIDNLDDVWMVDAAKRFYFVEEAPMARCVFRRFSAYSVLFGSSISRTRKTSLWPPAPTF